MKMPMVKHAHLAHSEDFLSISVVGNLAHSEHLLSLSILGNSFPFADWRREQSIFLCFHC
jgi:hypothetical protein